MPQANAKSELDIIDNGIVNGLSDEQIIAEVKGGDELIFKNGFEVNQPPILNSVWVSWNTLIDHGNNNYTISQNVDHDITFTANWTDVNGDRLQIEINEVLYNDTSKILTLNIPLNVIEQFNIRLYDWQDYSEYILVQLAWR